MAMLLKKIKTHTIVVVPFNFAYGSLRSWLYLCISAIAGLLVVGLVGGAYASVSHYPAVAYDRTATKMFPDERAKVFKEANEFFRQAGDASDPGLATDLYNKALLRYEQLIRTGLKNGKLYYNIGNTYFRLHDLGRSILNYRLAQLYLPDDHNLSENLALALSQQPDKIIPKQQEQIMKTLLFWHYDLPQRMRWLIFSVAYLIFWLIAFVRLIRGGRSPGFTSLFPLLIALMMGGSLAVNYFSPPPKTGVLLASQVIPRKGDGLSYKPSFTEPLHAGLDFNLLDKRNGWLHIELRDGRSCWIPDNSAATVTLDK